MNIAVIALGKIGLPLAVQFAGQGHQVLGVDINPHLVNCVNRGVEPFPGETDLARRLAGVVGDGSLRATTDTAEAVSQAEVVVIVVPLFVDAQGAPDFGWMDAATNAVASALQPGTLVSYETTLPVGTTRYRFGPMLEAGSGLKVGEDLALIFSPERVFTGRVFADLRRYPKLLGGVDKQSARRGLAFYESVLDFDDRPDLERANGVWDLGSAEAAEFAKLAETTYRDVNIGLANQFARFADTIGIDVYSVIEACNSQGFSHIHQPGIAVGGHCIPIYPRLYLWSDPSATVVTAAREANASMPDYAVSMLVRELGTLEGATVAVLGAAYRGGVKETAFSGVFPTVEAIRAQGGRPVVHDPMFDDSELVDLGFEPYHMGDHVDAAIVQSDHAEYKAISPADLSGIKVMLDGRRVTAPDRWTSVRHIVLGAPATQVPG